MKLIDSEKWPDELIDKLVTGYMKIQRRLNKSLEDVDSVTTMDGIKDAIRIDMEKLAAEAGENWYTTNDLDDISEQLEALQERVKVDTADINKRIKKVDAWREQDERQTTTKEQLHGAKTRLLEHINTLQQEVDTEVNKMTKELTERCERMVKGLASKEQVRNVKQVLKQAIGGQTNPTDGTDNAPKLQQ